MKRPAPHTAINVLHARVVTGRGGGPDKTILNSPAYADPARVTMACVYFHPQGDPGIQTLHERAEARGVEFVPLPEHGPISPMAIRRALDLCRALQINVWHAHDYKTDLMGLLLRRFHPMKLVSTMHGFTGETWRTRLYARMSRHALIRYDHVIAVSQNLVEHALTWGIPVSRLSLIRNAIELDSFQRERHTDVAKQALGLSPDEVSMGVIARLSPEKGVDRAVQTLATLRERHPAVGLHLFGDGPERQSIESLAETSGIRDAVTFHGWCDDPRAALEAMDLLLIPSHTEGLPNVLLEAMALGVPVASSPVGEVPTVLDGGRYGLLLDSDESTWPKALSHLIRHPSTRQAYADRAYERVLDQHAFHDRMRRVLSIYDRVLALPVPTAEDVPQAQAA